MSTLFDLSGFLDATGVMWRLGAAWEANELLSRHHYLGPLYSGGRMVIIGSRGSEPVAATIWKHPTSRNLPAFGTWLELSRWCLTASAGENAGSRMHRWSTRLIKQHAPEVTTLVSYSDPAHGHTGALYRACNWQWAPTWHRLRIPPSGNGNWGTGAQSVKDRWIFCVKPDPIRESVLRVDDRAAVRHWQANATSVERNWARRSLNLVDEQCLDVVPVDAAGLNGKAAAINVEHGRILPIQAHVPADQRAEHVRGVSFTPVEFHDRDLTAGSAS
jgi:hypothetical protein